MLIEISTGQARPLEIKAPDLWTATARAQRAEKGDNEILVIKEITICQE